MLHDLSSQEFLSNLLDGYFFNPCFLVFVVLKFEIIAAHKNDNNPLTGLMSFLAAEYGTCCPAHAYNTLHLGVLPYSFTGHFVPYFAAAKDPNPVMCFYRIYSTNKEL